MKICISSLTTIASYFIIKNNYIDHLNNILGQYWWVSPVLGHIILNTIQHQISYN